MSNLYGDVGVPTSLEEKPQRCCSVCGQAGHNKRGHGKAMGICNVLLDNEMQQASKKPYIKCSSCGRMGHTQETHDAWLALRKGEPSACPQNPPIEDSSKPSRHKMRAMVPNKDTLSYVELTSVGTDFEIVFHTETPHACVNFNMNGDLDTCLMGKMIKGVCHF